MTRRLRLELLVGCGLLALGGGGLALQVRMATADGAQARVAPLVCPLGPHPAAPAPVWRGDGQWWEGARR